MPTKHLINKLLLMAFIASSLSVTAADNDHITFNKNRHQLWYPAEYYFNGAFDVTQNNYLFTQDNFLKNNQSILSLCKNPIKAIENQGGWRKFISDEFFSIRVLPNIFLHTIASAYETDKLMGYADSYNLQWKKTFAFLITYAAHIGNEANENNNRDISAHDHIADLFFFDLAGFFLGVNTDFINFLVNDAGMSTWHFMPTFDIHKNQIFGASLNYIFRPKAFEFANVRPLFYTGMMNMIGLTYDTGRFSHSFSAGIFYTDPINIKGKLTSGYFLESNGELALSILMNSSEDFRFRFRFNFYPELFSASNQTPYDFSFMIGQQKNNGIAFAINVGLPIGIGFK